MMWRDRSAVAQPMILLMGVIPMPPASNNAGFELSLCKVNEPIGALTLTPCADRDRSQGPLECSVSHPRRYHKGTLIIRGSCKRQRSRIALAIGFRGIDQDESSVLSRSEGVAGAHRVKPERHGVFGHLLAVFQG